MKFALSRSAEPGSTDPMKPLAQWLIAAATLAIVAALVAGYLGRFFHPFDSFSHFRAHLAVAAMGGLVAIMIAKVRTGPAISLACLAGIACLSLPLALTAPYFGIDPGANTARSADQKRYSLLQMNLRYDADTAPAIDRLRTVGADIVTLQEATERWVVALSKVEDIYPYRAFCGARKPHGGNVILSKFEINDDRRICSEPLGLLVAPVELSKGRFLTVVSQHLVWPWPYKQWLQLAALSPVLPTLEKPMIVGGDFNAVPWSAAVDAYADMTETRQIEGIGATFAPYGLPASWRPIIGLPIDNVLISDDIEILSTGALPATASDHLPVLTHFSFRP